MAAYRDNVIGLDGEGLRFIDQTLLPGELRIVRTRDYRDVLEAIRTLRLRGAPLIGISAAYGVALAAREMHTAQAVDSERLLAVCNEFAATRPTAVNLFWALEIVRTLILRNEPSALPVVLEENARALHADDARRCAAIGLHGADLLPRNAGVITHCNTGAFATGGDGTAFSVLLEAHRRGRGIHVYADETRPLLQGARLTMWELREHGIPATLITDGTAAMLMRQGGIGAAISGADRIAANGDSANKIGTYALAIAAHAHGIPFYIAAPLSTVDLSVSDGSRIPIEQRAASEVLTCHGTTIAPENSAVYAPAFDVTPAELISGIITEQGVSYPPYNETLAGVHPYKSGSE
ncbi:MAG: S-methyl-5-thioribose-1-phosphate isomerase [Bacteroidia bacterium]|nr:S-methyl-5-thioribose-1-phosphate isomerase [Bacteroidia bacterium]